MKNPIIVALDLDDVSKASQLASRLAPYVGGFKVGPRLTFRADRKFLKDLSQSGILFFDHKFFDIPSTTASAVEVAAEMGAHWVTVHGLSGPECLKQLSAVETKIQKSREEFRILVVTVLTSFSKESLPPVWKNQSVGDSVASLAESAAGQGLNSFVCSPEEVELLKTRIKQSFLVVPGIRPAGSDNQDQRRVATPAQALKAGASALVIGRPIIEQADPINAVKRILDEIESKNS
jgi:orotidine-5'-phosphate decarboxylase